MASRILDLQRGAPITRIDVSDFELLLKRMANADETAAWKKGWLLKKRLTHPRIWERRFFVLEPPMLYAYESEGGKPVGLICIEGALTFAEERRFRVVSAGGRSHWFATVSADDADEWRVVLERAQGHVRSPQINNTLKCVCSCV